MELAPIKDSVVSEFTAAKLVYKLIGYQALAQNWQKDGKYLAIAILWMVVAKFHTEKVWENQIFDHKHNSVKYSNRKLQLQLF